MRRRCSDARVLDSETAITADCEPKGFRSLVREWPDRDGAEGYAEAMHQRDLERAAQPPVIEVTVTTPPEGIPRLELTRLVAETVAGFTGPQPALLPAAAGKKSRRRMPLTAIRRACSRMPDVPSPPAWPAGTGWVLPASQDDTPTVELPPYPDDGFTLVEVHVP